MISFHFIPFRREPTVLYGFHNSSLGLLVVPAFSDFHQSSKSELSTLTHSRSTTSNCYKDLDSSPDFRSPSHFHIIRIQLILQILLTHTHLNLYRITHSYIRLIQRSLHAILISRRHLEHPFLSIYPHHHTSQHITSTASPLSAWLLFKISILSRKLLLSGPWETSMTGS